MKNRFLGCALLLVSLLSRCDAFAPVAIKPPTRIGPIPSTTTTTALSAGDMDSVIPVLLGVGALISTIKPDLVSDGNGAGFGNGEFEFGGWSSGGSSSTDAEEEAAKAAAAAAAAKAEAAAAAAGAVAAGYGSAGEANASGGSSSGTGSNFGADVCVSAYRLARALLFPWIGMFRK